MDMQDDMEDVYMRRSFVFEDYTKPEINENSLLDLVYEAGNDPNNPQQQQQPAGNDYGAVAPEPPQQDPTDAGAATPEGGTIQQEAPPQDPQQQGDPQGQPAPGGAPDPNAGGAPQGDPNAPPDGAQQDPGGDPNQPQGEEMGPEGDPEAAGAEGEGGEEDPNSLGEDSTVNQDMGGDKPEDEQRRAGATIVSLLRSYISLYTLCNRTIRKIGEARRKSLLATATYRQVKDNLYRLSKLIYSYIMLEFDGTEHEMNVYNFNYFLEIFSWNIQMLEKVDEIHKKIEEKEEESKAS